MSLRLAILAPSASDNDHQLINNAITTAIACLNNAWSIADSSQAHLILIWVNSEKDLKALQVLQEKYPSERIIVLAANEFRIQAHWHLSYLKHNTVPSILSIANLLSRIQAHFLPSDSPETPVAFDPDDCLFGIVQQAINDNIGRICSYQSCPDIYLLPKENAFYLSGNMEQLIPMALAKRQDINITEVNDQQILETVSYVKFSSRLSQYMFLDEDSIFNDINVKKYKRYALNELVWFAVLIGSRGCLSGNIPPTETVLLKQLPEYMRLEYYGREYKELADCMSSNALSLFDIRAKTGKSLFEIIGFYNACNALNLIEHGESARQIIQKNLTARSTLETIFTPVGQRLKGRIKIVIAGSVGSGKTAAISALSDFAPISTETRPSDSVTRKKSTTTVAMDYGEMRFNNQLRVFLYGTPGQKRFDFMSQLLCENAWGMLLLIDNTENDPIAELDYYLKLFEKFLDKIQLAIGITHCDITEKPGLETYIDHLRQRNLSYPVLRVDARDTPSLVELLSTLVDHGTHLK